MKKTLLVMMALLLIGCAAAFLLMGALGGVQEGTVKDQAGSFYDLQTRTLEGEPADLGQYRGQVALVVNLASKCGLTPQYEGIEELYRELLPRGFVVLGFPSNDFLGQEPGSPAEIRAFCTTEYGVTFPLFEKVKVKGEDRSKVYDILCAELDEPSWNFTKYLVDRQGRVRYRFGPRTPPDDPQLRSTLEELLSEEAGS